MYIYCMLTIFFQSSLFHKIEEHVYCVEAKVEALISPLVDVSVNSRELIEAAGHLRNVLDEVVSLIIRALYFVILKVSPYVHVYKLLFLFVRVLCVCIEIVSVLCVHKYMYNSVSVLIPFTSTNMGIIIIHTIMFTPNTAHHHRRAIL